MIAIICSASSIIVLKEGTIMSTKNLKWMILSIISFFASVTSYCLLRVHDKIDVDEDRRLFSSIKLVLQLFSKWIASGWALVLGLFLVSAFLSSKRDQEALKQAALKAGEAAGKAKDAASDAKDAAAEKGKKAAGKAAGAAAAKLSDFAKKME